MLILGGCGPRADSGGGGAVNRGDPPKIDGFNSQFPRQKAPSLEGTANGTLVVFPIRFIIRATDADSNMRQVLITVSYTDCLGVQQKVELVHELSATEQVASEIVLDQVTDDVVQIPRSCYAVDNLFAVRERVIDWRGNLSSNSVLDILTIQVGQGSGG